MRCPAVSGAFPAAGPSGQRVPHLHRFSRSLDSLLSDGCDGGLAGDRRFPVDRPGASLQGAKVRTAFVSFGAAVLLLQHGDHK